MSAHTPDPPPRREPGVSAQGSGPADPRASESTVSDADLDANGEVRESGRDSGRASDATRQTEQ